MSTMYSGNREALEEEATEIIKKELVTPEDLGIKIRKIIEACDRDEYEIRRSIASITNIQMTETERAHRLLKQSHVEVQSLKGDLSSMNDIVENMDASGAFKHLKQVYTFRKNVNSVVKWTESLKAIQYSNCGAELMNGNVMFVYELARDVMSIKQEVTKSGHQYRQQQAVFIPYFDKADVIIQMLVEKIKEIFTETIAVTIEAAIEMKETDTFLILKDCVDICAQEREKPLIISSETGEVLLREGVVATAVTKSVAEYWDENILGDVVDITREVGAVLEGMRKLEAIMSATQETLAPISMKFPICNICLQAFNGEVVSTLGRYVEPTAGVDSKSLIESMQFCFWYAEFLSESSLIAHVNEETLEELGADLLAAAVVGMKDHMTHLSKNVAVIVAKDPPSSLPNGKLYTNGPADLFEMLNQSLASVTSTAEDEVLLELGGACSAALEAYNEQIKDMSHMDTWEDKYEETNKTQQEWEDERLLVLCAYCNDLDAMETGIDSVEATFAKLVSSRTDSLFDDNLQSLPDVGFYLLDEITEMIQRVVDVAWKKMFGANKCEDWFVVSGESNPLLVITSTIGEYLNQDLSVFLEETWFTKLCRQLLSSTTASYIRYFFTALRDASNKHFDADDWATRVARDVGIWRQFWSDALMVSENNNAQRAVNTACDALMVLKHLLEATEPVQFSLMLSREILDEFGDCPTFIVQMILDKRDKELDKKTREQLIATWRDRISYQNRDNDTDRPTSGWSTGKSYFGGLVQKDFVVEKQGFFSKKKDPAKEAELEKKKRKEKRKQAKAAAAAATSSPSAKQPPKTEEVEVESLAALLGS